MIHEGLYGTGQLLHEVRKYKARRFVRGDEGMLDFGDLFDLENLNCAYKETKHEALYP
jgi:hypothetical protein